MLFLGSGPVVRVHSETLSAVPYRRPPTYLTFVESFPLVPSPFCPSLSSPTLSLSCCRELSSYVVERTLVSVPLSSYHLRPPHCAPGTSPRLHVRPGHVYPYPYPHPHSVPYPPFRNFILVKDALLSCFVPFPHPSPRSSCSSCICSDLASVAYLRVLIVLESVRSRSPFLA
ncbi:hypothetical protein L227DRAFT_576013, partial [Lentinus tigrinus ALCF2SS1-6]